MATVRDPAFWKRFSTAVHLNDVESQPSSAASSPNLSKRPTLERQDTWLGRQERKKKKRTLICWAFWACFLVFAAGIAVVIVWLVNSGMFAKLGRKIAGQG